MFHSHLCLFVSDWPEDLLWLICPDGCVVQVFSCKGPDNDILVHNTAPDLVPTFWMLAWCNYPETQSSASQHSSVPLAWWCQDSSLLHLSKYELRTRNNHPGHPSLSWCWSIPPPRHPVPGRLAPTSPSRRKPCTCRCLEYQKESVVENVTACELQTKVSHNLQDDILCCHAPSQLKPNTPGQNLAVQFTLQNKKKSGFSEEIFLFYFYRISYPLIMPCKT